jgi:hypothetical protein
MSSWIFLTLSVLNLRDRPRKIDSYCIVINFLASKYLSFETFSRLMFKIMSPYLEKWFHKHGVET